MGDWEETENEDSGIYDPLNNAYFPHHSFPFASYSHGREKAYTSFIICTTVNM